MITVNPDNHTFNSSDAKLNDAVNTHIGYMSCFSEDGDIKYSVLIAEGEDDVNLIGTMNVDYVDINGDYYEANIIEDNSVTVAIIHKDLVKEIGGKLNV